LSQREKSLKEENKKAKVNEEEREHERERERESEREREKSTGHSGTDRACGGVIFSIQFYLLLTFQISPAVF